MALIFVVGNRSNVTETWRSGEFSARAYVATYSDWRDGSDFSAFSWYPQSVHSVSMSLSSTLSLRCCPMRETPIYEQLRGERINADVPSSETGPSRVGHPGRHRLVPDTTGSVAACRPPGPGADLVVHQHVLPGIGVQPPGGPQRTAALRGPRAPVPRPARAGQALAPAASSPPTATGVLDLPEAAGGGSVAPERVIRPRQVQRPDCSVMATPEGQFPWFEVDYDSRGQRFR